MEHVDLLTVIVATLIYMIIHSFWYSPLLFGPLWKKLKGLKNEEMRKKWIAIFFNFISAFILAFFLSLIEVYVGANSFLDGIVAGFVIYVGFIFPILITDVIWVKKSFKLFLIENAPVLISVMTMGGLLAG